MSQKIEIDELQNILIQAGVDQKTRSVIVKEAQELISEKQQDAADNKEPKAKNQYVVVVKTDADLTGKTIVSTIIQIPESDDPNKVIDKIKDAAREQNRSAKRKKSFVANFTDGLRYIKRKYLKNQGVHLKSKDWVQTIVLTDEGI